MPHLVLGKAQGDRRLYSQWDAEREGPELPPLMPTQQCAVGSKQCQSWATVGSGEGVSAVHMICHMISVICPHDLCSEEDSSKF